MTLDERVRRALRAEGDGAHPTSEIWERVRAGVGARRRRRRMLARSAAAGAVAAAVVAAVVVVAAGGDGGEPSGVVAGPPASTALPEGIVAVTEDGRVVELSPETGEEVRTLLDPDEAGLAQYPVGANFSAPTVAVAPGGRILYLARPRVDPACAHAEQLDQEIVAVPLGEGSAEVVAAVGSHPAVSPDGTMLAYVTTRSGEACDPSRVVAVEDLAGGRAWVLDPFAPPPGEADHRGELVATGSLAWSVDGRTLSLSDLAPRPESYGVLVDVRGDHEQDRYVRTFGDGRGGPAATFLGDRGLLAFDDSDEEVLRVSTIPLDVTDPVFEDVTPTMMFEMPLPERSIASVRSLRSDPSGEHVLLVAEVSEPGSATATRLLYRWSRGDREPQPLAEGILDAAWTAEPRRCSADGVVVVPGGDLPAAVAATARAIVDAAADCDFDRLAGLMADDFAFGFGGLVGPDAAVERWRDDEARGVPVLARLVGVLSLEPAVDPDGAGWIWPAAFTWTSDDWARATPGELAPLTEVYGPGVVEQARDVGFLDHRLAIEADGTWRFFVSGD